MKAATRLPDETALYRAMAVRDSAADGVFVVAVRTTGIFCRPTCPSRTPLPHNVEFHATGWEALLAGFRPCRRCRPMDPPDTDRRGPAGPAERAEMTVTRIETPLGTMVAAAVDAGIVVLEFAERRRARTALRDAARRFEASPTIGHHPHLDALRTQLAEYFAGTRRSFDVPLAPFGTRFESSVWVWLATIPAGETRTYAQGAEAVGRPTAVRAVGRANGANRLAIVIPCHRVIGSDGELTGYGGGLWRKRALLDLEAGTRAG